jgi:hypothetical protein
VQTQTLGPGRRAAADPPYVAPRHLTTEWWPVVEFTSAWLNRATSARRSSEPFLRMLASVIGSIGSSERAMDVAQRKPRPEPGLCGGPRGGQGVALIRLISNEGDANMFRRKINFKRRFSRRIQFNDRLSIGLGPRGQTPKRTCGRQEPRSAQVITFQVHISIVRLYAVVTTNEQTQTATPTSRRFGRLLSPL